MAPSDETPSARQDRYVLARELVDVERSADGTGVAESLQGLCRAMTTYLDVLGVAVNLTSGQGSAGVIAASDDCCPTARRAAVQCGRGTVLRRGASGAVRS